MGWNKSCIGLDDKGSIKVDREKAEILVARYAKSDIMEGKKSFIFSKIIRQSSVAYCKSIFENFYRKSVKALREVV